jgi:hypothetical protein
MALIPVDPRGKLPPPPFPGPPIGPASRGLKARWDRPGAVCDDAPVEQSGTDDPVLERRRRIARLVRLGQRLGYGLFGVAIALFVVGLVAGFGGVVGGGIIAAIVVGSVVLAPAIVFGYAVRAAEREDREQGRL